MDYDPDRERAAAALEASGDYRVLRRLRRKDQFFEDDGSSKLVGIVLDIETTGLDSSKDEVIELGMVKFEFNSDGRIFKVLDVFDNFRQPRTPIPVEIAKLTGITDDMVRGHFIDDSQVSSFVESSAIVIAHNAVFDRKFCERLFPCFVKRAWACSANEIDWRREGHSGSRLDYLLMDEGFFHDGHRAVEDCFALLEILSRPLIATKELALKRLLDTARKATVRIDAEGAPFDQRGVLKERGYRWNPGEDGGSRSWWRELPEDQVDAELAFLKEVVYQREIDIPIVRLTAFDRFSDRG